MTVLSVCVSICVEQNKQNFKSILDMWGGCYGGDLFVIPMDSKYDTLMYAYMLTHMCMHTCMHACIRTHIHKHTHAHTHTHTHPHAHTTVSILDCRLEVNSPLSLHMLTTTPSLGNSKVRNWKSVSLFPLSHYHWKLNCYRTKIFFVCRHVCALFSADIFQAGTVKKW